MDDILGTGMLLISFLGMNQSNPQKTRGWNAVVGADSMAAQLIEKWKRSGLLDPYIFQPGYLDANAMTAEYFFPSLQESAGFGVLVDKRIHAAGLWPASDRIPFARARGEQCQ